MKIYMKTECITWYGHYSNDHKIEITEGFYLNLQDAKGSGKWRETKKVDKITKKVILESREAYEDEYKNSIEYIYEIEVR